MDRSAQIKFPIPEEDLVYSGHTACPGCGAVLALKYVLKGLGPRTIVVIPPSCAGTIVAPFPYSALKFSSFSGSLPVKPGDFTKDLKNHLHALYAQ